MPNPSDPPALGSFASRHLGCDPTEQRAMLEALEVDSLDALIEQVVPAAIRCTEPLDLPPGLTEEQALAALQALAAQNQPHKSFIGQGYYGCHTPAVIARNLLENPAWYTAYTPYQAEISQGRLEALLNFQTMISSLTGLPLANASLLDEASAAAEAMILCRRAAKSKAAVFLVDHDIFPQTLDVLRTRAEPLGIELAVGDPEDLVTRPDYCGLLVQYPGCSGEVRPPQSLTGLAEKAHERGALLVVAADLLALTLLQSPGSIGADVAIGSAQRFGTAPGFGGPHAAYMAARDSLKRALPGRVVGVSVDAAGRPAYRLALQTREQHIRREKATSNVCTAQVLLAIMASMYAVYHGPEGLRQIAQRVQRLTAALACGLREQGFALANRRFFDTLTVRTGSRTAQIHAAAHECNINLRQIDSHRIGVSLDETTEPQDVAHLLQIFAPNDDSQWQVEQLEKTAEPLDDHYLRRDPILPHPVFHQHRTETKMMRYLRHLADRDIALDRAMIPLGSCTMKLNAAAEMAPISWQNFAQMHPFAPPEQTAGYQQMMAQLRQMLCAITGYPALSLQPNAGSQGEVAGLLAIRAYHAHRGDAQRTICLIPRSAHGTNPASAQLCNMQVVAVECDAHGNIDMQDLRAKCQAHAAQLAAIMLTYPSTHGVFEPQVQVVCALIHDHGGQVYLDGANLNAMVGLCRPAQIGADIMHMNLHKTFCIPHGGGGPGLGPVAAAAHLAPFLPGHHHLPPTDANHTPPGPVGPVTAAPYGSAGILPISWMYLKMMGGAGLTQATRQAILAANYIATRLQLAYPVLYRGDRGRVAHECIIDLRPLKESTGIGVEDVAKRLIDFGFHAPTMSFPVPGTLMIEPTESESKAEIDRFCDALLCIRQEIAAIERGDWPPDDNPLVNAPHTAESLCAENWPHPYTREQAAYPIATVRQNKYWPPVARVDNVQGDKNLICTCPTLDSYE